MPRRWHVYLACPCNCIVTDIMTVFFCICFMYARMSHTNFITSAMLYATPIFATLRQSQNFKTQIQYPQDTIISIF